MIGRWEPKTGTDDLYLDYDSVDPKLLEMQAALYREVMLETLIGRRDDGMDEYWESVGRALKMKTFHGKGDNNTSIFRDEPKLPQKICNYRKPKVYWFGELHGSNNLAHNPDFTMSHTGFSTTSESRHWSVFGDTIEEYKGKRFIGISEPPMEDQVDNDFLKKFTGDEWVETRTLKGPFNWEPQGEIFITSGKPLKINKKDKDTLEQVAAISYPPAE